MAKEPLFASPYYTRKRKQREEIISSYYQMKKDPRNSVAEWKKHMATKYGISEFTIAKYLRNRNKTSNS